MKWIKASNRMPDKAEYWLANSDQQDGRIVLCRAYDKIGIGYFYRGNNTLHFSYTYSFNSSGYNEIDQNGYVLLENFDQIEWLDEQADDWIDADITPPAEKQDCAFIVINEHNLSINGRVLGGRYMGKPYGVHEFAVPGHGYYARFWQPLPSKPAQRDKQ